MRSVTVNTQTKRRCSRCNSFKAVSEFNHKSYCKPCETEYRREYRRNYQNDSNKPKTCPSCGITKTRADFYSNNAYCKECQSAKAKEKRRRNNPNIKDNEALPEGKKRCGACKEVFDVKNIYRGKCKPCNNAKQRKRYNNLKNIDPNKTKVCRDCDVAKPLSEYTNPKYSYCRDCFNARLRVTRRRKAGY